MHSAMQSFIDYALYWVCLIFALVYLVVKKDKLRIGQLRLATVKSMWNVGGPTAIPFVGNVISLWGTPEETFQVLRKLAKSYPPFYKLWGLSTWCLNIHEPQDLEVVLSSTKLIKKSELYKLTQSWLHDGLLTTTGSKWKLRRKMIAPVFHGNLLREFVYVFGNNSIKLADFLHTECNRESTNVVPFMRDFALASLCETLMGCQVDSKSEMFREYKENLIKFFDVITYRAIRPWYYSDTVFFLSPTGRKTIKVLKFLHTFTRDVIKRRLKTWEESSETAAEKKRFAFLDLLISQMKVGAIDLDGVREEVDTFMFGGHDTTTLANSYCLMLLANHPEIQDRVVEEVRSILGNTDRIATYDELHTMVYLEMCIKESLRMFPSAPILGREATQDFELRGQTFSPGLTILMHIYDLHHNPNIWPDPKRFDPDRFLPENTRNMHPYSFIPFSAGPRRCIGQQYAMLVMKSLISKLLLKYVLEPVDNPENIQISANIVLQPRDGIHVKFRKRISSTNG